MNLLDFLIFLNERARNEGMSLKERLFLQAIGAIAFVPISKQLAASRAGLDKPSFVSLLERIYTLASGLEVFNSVNDSARRLAKFAYQSALEYLGKGSASEEEGEEVEDGVVDEPAEGAVEAAMDSLAQFYTAPLDSEKLAAPGTSKEPSSDSALSASEEPPAEASEEKAASSASEEPSTDPAPSASEEPSNDSSGQHIYGWGV